MTCRPKSKVHLEDRLLGLMPGEHICCLYDTLNEYRQTLLPFLRHGVHFNQKTIFIIDSLTITDIMNFFQDTEISVKQCIENGMLSILTPWQSYLANETFHPDSMIEFLLNELKHALREGRQALRVTGEMSWASKRLPGAERLIEYEDKLNRIIPCHKMLALCQYERGRFSSDQLQNIGHTHPVTVEVNHYPS